MSKTKTARPPDPRTLARAIVDTRLALFGDWFGFIHGSGEGDSAADEEQEALVSAILAEQHPEVTPAVSQAFTDVLLSTIDPELQDVPGYLEEANAIAGFLVGLELGRRLGSVR